MPKPTLLFIPDISGFTKFVNHTEVQHGQHIISELLELLIDSNNLGLELSEIEGDALLFYKQGELPDQASLMELVRKMFLGFHQHLKRYQTHRICECGACRTAGNLTLKFIIHAGPIDFIKVKDRSKPYGSDVILAHRLLKNPIENPEYALLSDKVLDPQEELTDLQNSSWIDFKKGTAQYDSLEAVDYYYTSLTNLRAQVPEPEESLQNGTRSTKPIIVSTHIDKPAAEVFETIIDFEQRMNWNKFAKDIQYEDPINQLGSKHVCVFDSHSLEFETVTNDFGKNSLVYGERVLTLPPFTSDLTVYFIVSENGKGSQVQLAVHPKLKGLLGWLISPYFRYTTTKTNKKVLAHLKSWCERSTDD